MNGFSRSARDSRPWRRMVRGLALAATLPGIMPVAADISGIALVSDEGTLNIRNHEIVLRGITIPALRENCRTFERPPRCGSAAVLALEFRIQGFVHCEDEVRQPDGRFLATCHSGRSAFEDGVDLAAYLVKRGWALAGPDAPREYAIFEDIARHHGVGIWGSPGLLAD